MIAVCWHRAISCGIAEIGSSVKQCVLRSGKVFLSPSVPDLVHDSSLYFSLSLSLSDLIKTQRDCIMRINLSSAVPEKVARRKFVRLCQEQGLARSRNPFGECSHTFLAVHTGTLDV